MSRRRTVPVRVPEQIAERLQAEADARGIGRDWMAGKLLEEALGNLAPAEQFSLFRKRPAQVERPDPTRRLDDLGRPVPSRPNPAKGGRS